MASDVQLLCFFFQIINKIKSLRKSAGMVAGGADGSALDGCTGLGCHCG